MTIEIKCDRCGNVRQGDFKKSELGWKGFWIDDNPNIKPADLCRSCFQVYLEFTTKAKAQHLALWQEFLSCIEITGTVHRVHSPKK